MSTAKFLSAVACEDVRTEASGSVTLVGVFTGPIGFESGKDATRPPRLPIAFYVEVEMRDATTFEFEFKRRGASRALSQYGVEVERMEDDEVLGPLSSKMNRIALPIPKRQYAFRRPGDYVLRGRLRGGRWKELLSFYAVIDGETD